MTTAEIPESAQALVKGADERYEEARGLFKTAPAEWSSVDYALAESMLREVHQQLKAVEDERTKLKAPVLETGRRIDEFFRKISSRLEEGKALLKRGMVTRNEAVDRKRREEEQRLREEQRRQQEQEQRRLADQRRQAEEEAAKAEAEGRTEDVAVAVELVAEAETQAAAVALTPPVVLEREKPRGERENWHGECTDVLMLATAVVVTHLRRSLAADQRIADRRMRVALELQDVLLAGAEWNAVPTGAIVPNSKMIGELARSLKGEMRWPGVRVWMTKDVAAAGVRS